MWDWGRIRQQRCVLEVSAKRDALVSNRLEFAAAVRFGLAEGQQFTVAG